MVRDVGVCRGILRAASCHRNRQRLFVVFAEYACIAHVTVCVQRLVNVTSASQMGLYVDAAGNPRSCKEGTVVSTTSRLDAKKSDYDSRKLQHCDGTLYLLIDSMIG